ncbi:hypothetical protein H8S10_14360 [Clostridium sp. NSJ-49]|uniref:Z1 domain-containing protein n=1 Tax=Clostridium sp. NSJ-49 TaxID=2763034 RepID=UPI00164CAC43|nr:Z1 domain-containing protein [Clostridium sp. NSJ-49]MBC5626632.1 hypothetical protein [Clostridium sp. NSJ-49]
MILDGEFFSVKSEGYNEKTYNCVVQAVEKLEEIGDKPLMMLGKIQSGKTRSFIGVISLAFDNGYDLAVVLTKNSNALAKQTTARMKDEFKEFKDEDIIEIFDIMCMPPSMSQFELDKKMIIVVKKEKNNIPKLMKFIEEYGLHENKRCLIIDDEADFCSVGYDKNKDSEEFDLRRIASQINELRLQLTCKFIQVTATPYSLYLQPETIDLGSNKDIRAIKPADTVLVPHGDGYIGGEYYFDREKHPLGEHLFYAIYDKELQIIKSSDRRKFKDEEVLTSDKVEGLRTSIINFIVGGCVRIIQNGGNPRGKRNKFSFIIHTEISKASHTRQENLISMLIEKLEEEAKNNSQLLDKFIEESYNNIAKSVNMYGFDVPSLEQVNTYVKRAIKEQWVTKVVVNSENDINALLDDDGQLKLRTPLNIFIGGQILDRGITIANLIGFYYGRAPQKMQQDTVLQHSRMYGYRSKEDLAVTRFYTTNEIYSRMSKINDFDAKLREDFEQGNLDKGVIFISKDEKGRVIPCSPQKILISNTQILKPGKTTTIVGFQTGYISNIKKYLKEIDNIIIKNNINNKLDGEFKVSKDDAIRIIKLIYKTIELENSTCIDENAFVSLINYLSTDYVNIYCRTNRNMARKRRTRSSFSDTPYSGTTDLKISKNMAINEPTLMLLKQNSSDPEWKSPEFYWPVLVVQENVDTAVYTSELIK